MQVRLCVMSTGKGGAINDAGPVTARCALRVHVQPIIIETSGLPFCAFRDRRRMRPGTEAFCAH